MVRAKRSLSQNFLVDHNLRRKLVEALDPGPTDAVLEVGPGHGELSEILVDRAGRVVLVEKDDRLAPLLSDRWRDRDDVRVVHGDALELDLSSLAAEATAGSGVGGLRLISNVPYAITSPLLFRMLDVRPRPDRIVVLVQEEVARRIVARPGGKEYGALTVGVQTQAHAELAFRVGRGAFRPVPGVDSAAVVLRPAPRIVDDRREALRDLARAAFSRRRKQIRTILRTTPDYGLAAGEADDILAALGISPTARPETIPPEGFVALSERLLDRGPSDG